LTVDAFAVDNCGAEVVQHSGGAKSGLSEIDFENYAAIDGAALEAGSTERGAVQIAIRCLEERSAAARLSLANTVKDVNSSEGLRR
jgi:hypothetical protein